MTPDAALIVAQHALELALLLITVLLVPALVVGLIVSMFQAATQINEMTLSFFPKLIVAIGTLMLAGPWITQLLVSYTQDLIENIPYLIG
jgi:flagellar biosynthetic protein FliQ